MSSRGANPETYELDLSHSEAVPIDACVPSPGSGRQAAIDAAYTAAQARPVRIRRTPRPVVQQRIPHLILTPLTGIDAGALDSG